MGAEPPGHPPKGTKHSRVQKAQEGRRNNPPGCFAVGNPSERDFLLPNSKLDTMKRSNMEAKRIVFKVGTSTLTYENGKLNLHRIESLCKVLSDLQNSGKEIVLVSSGAIGVGVGKLGLPERPKETSRKQAVAAVGQCELMFIYDKLFGEYNHTVAQILLTRDVMINDHSKQNVINTFQELLAMGIIPVVNENDTVAIDELEGSNFGDNDTLSAIVADIAEADALVILTDIDGLYDADPRKSPEAKRIPEVRYIDENIRKMAGGSGSNRGTGGMSTKISAAVVAMEAGIDCYVISGNDPAVLYDLLEGKDVGTRFRAK